jgi:hypothetical protein
MSIRCDVSAASDIIQRVLVQFGRCRMCRRRMVLQRAGKMQGAALQQLQPTLLI